MDVVDGKAVEVRMTLAEYLRQVRMRQRGDNGKQLSLTAIHQRCGLSVPVLSKLEGGKVSDPSGSTIKRLLAGYNLTFEDFAQYLPDPHREKTNSQDPSAA